MPAPFDNAKARPRDSICHLLVAIGRRQCVVTAAEDQGWTFDTGQVRNAVRPAHDCPLLPDEAVAARLASHGLHCRQQRRVRQSVGMDQKRQQHSGNADKATASGHIDQPESPFRLRGCVGPRTRIEQPEAQNPFRGLSPNFKRDIAAH
jgi:hypothetical protein